MSNCVMCSNEVKGFNDPRSIREYKISGMCQACQDEVFGVVLEQLCAECNVVIPAGNEIRMSNYAVCSDECARNLVGV